MKIIWSIMFILSCYAVASVLVANIVFGESEWWFAIFWLGIAILVGLKRREYDRRN